MKVAVVQAQPKPFDLAGTLEVVKEKVNEVRGHHPDLILFPEAFIPLYPRGFSFGAPVGSRSDEGKRLWELLKNNSVVVPSNTSAQLGEIAKGANAMVVIGVVECDQVNGSLYCSLLYFGKDGSLLGVHRKIKPTGAERVIWGEGDGSGLTTFRTDQAVVGGLICWENYMPLARMAMYKKGVQVYLAPTADQRDTWHATLQHIACEGRCFVLGCNQFLTKSSIPESTPCYSDLKHLPEIVSRGGSIIVDPMGGIIAGPLWDEEGVLIADLDLSLVDRSKLDFDPVGHYNRPDIFEFSTKDMPETKVL